MTSVTTIPTTPPSHADRNRIEQQVREEGLACGVEDCGREATDVQIEDWIARELWGEERPSAWACPDSVHICSDCRGEGRPPGLSGPEVCWRCDGTGEWDENDTERRPAHPSERHL